MTDAKTKLTIYMPTKELEQIQVEAERLDRSLSWLVTHVWRRSYLEVQDIRAPGAEPRAARVRRARPQTRRLDEKHEAFGETKTLREWAEDKRRDPTVPTHLFWCRFCENGWTVEEALTIKRYGRRSTTGDASK